MARLAIVGLLSLAVLVLEVSSQSSSGSGNLTDYEYYDYDNGTTAPVENVWIEPFIPIDPTWSDELCVRYRDGAIIIIKNYKTCIHFV